MECSKALIYPKKIQVENQLVMLSFAMDKWSPKDSFCHF